MFDIEKFLDDYRAAIHVRESGESVIIAPPFFHPYCGESIAIKISVLPDGRPAFTDCGTTVDYLETKYVNISQYEKRLNAITETFNLTFNDGVFCMEAPSDGTIHVLDAFSSFIEAISVIANIDI